jgi:sodium/potassium/calcium exchanger 6
MNFDTNIFVPYILVAFLITTTLAALTIRYAPRDTPNGSNDSNMAMTFAVPIALFGFAIAATWIDWIASQLVGVLGFLGVIFGIPGSIMGMTILAWGNSIADLAADITMAKKGLANMAITACFAGPIFNILVGLGLGFKSMLYQTSQDSVDILNFPPNVKAGIAFLIINCAAVLFFGLVINKGRVPMEYGYCGLTLYVVYLVTALTLYFSAS